MKHYEREDFLVEAEMTYTYIFGKQADKRALQRRKTRFTKQSDLDGVGYCEVEIAHIERLIEDAACSLYRKAKSIL